MTDEREVRGAMAAAQRDADANQAQGTGKFVREAHASQLEGSEPRAAQKDPGSMVTPVRGGPMTFVFSGCEVSAATAKILADADRAAQRQQEREEAEREAAHWRAMTTAPAIRAQIEADQAQMEAEAVRADRIAERERQERIAAARDHAEMLVASGQARWRTVAEVLEASRSWP